MKKILPFVIVIGVVSLVACAGLGSCETTVYADENNFRLEGHKAQAVTPSSNPIGEYPSLGGIYDYWATDSQTGLYSYFFNTGWLDITYVDESWIIDNTNYWFVDIPLPVTLPSIGGSASPKSYPDGWGRCYYTGPWQGYPMNVNGFNRSIGINPSTNSFRIKVAKADGFNTKQSVIDTFNDTNKIGYLQYELASPAGAIDYKDYLKYPRLDDIYEQGYQDGYDYAVETLFDMKMGVYIQWNVNSNSNRTFNVEWSSGGVVIGSQNLSYYNSTVYFERPMSSTYTFSITASNGVPFSVTYSSVNYPNESQTVTSDLAYRGVYYLPTWEGSITLTVNPDDIVTGWPSDYDFSLDSSQYLHVNLSSTFAAGYRQGVLDGYADGYASGADDVRSLAYSMGRSDGYADGYDYGYRVGYNEGENAVSEGGLVVANLFGAVAGVPISILNGLSGLTIWSIPLISVLMSFMFLGIILWVVKKFI